MALPGVVITRKAPGHQLSVRSRTDPLKAKEALSGPPAGRCSLRTWVCRVAHNVGASHVLRQRRTRGQGLVGLEELENLPDANSGQLAADRGHALGRQHRELFNCSR